MHKDDVEGWHLYPMNMSAVDALSPFDRQIVLDGKTTELITDPKLAMIGYSQRKPVQFCMIYWHRQTAKERDVPPMKGTSKSLIFV